MKISFPMRLISKDNSKIRNRQGRYFLTRENKGFERAIQNYTISQYRGKLLEGPLWMVITAYFKDKRHADCYNLPKSVCDSLEGLCYKNDRQIKDGRVVVLENQPKDYFTVEIGSLEK